MPTPLARDDYRHFRSLLTEQATASFLLLSFGMGMVALLLPPALVATGGYANVFSISYYYHAGELPRNLLVGALWALGVFLFLYQGLSRVENWLLNAAGALAIAVALNPVAAEQCRARGLSVHAACALLFFLCLAVVAVALSRTRVRRIVDPGLRRRFTLAYRLCGGLMLTAPALIATLHLSGRGGCESHWIFWAETAAVWAFAGYWLVKTLEYGVLLGAGPFAGE